MVFSDFSIRFTALFLVLACGLTTGSLQAQRVLGERPVKERIERDVKHAMQSVTTRECYDHISWLADDLREGRLSGTSGALDSADYIQKEFKNLGLLPGGVDGDWYQSFIIPGRTGARGPLSSGNRLRFKVSENATRSVPLSFSEEFLPHPFSPDADLEAECSFLLFSGQPADQVTRDPLAGRLAVMPVDSVMNDADLREACKEVQARGGLGILLIGEGASPLDNEEWPPSTGQAGESLPIPVVRVFGSGPLKLWKISGRPERSWKFQSDADGPLLMGRPLVDLEVRRQGRDLSQGRNVIAKFLGSDPSLRSEYIVIGAHYDHVGRTGMDGSQGEIHNGADDNATGVAALLEIAEAYSLARLRPKRSLIFIAFDAEELGLHGSGAFVASSGFDPSTLHGMINLDMIGRNDVKTVKVGRRTSDQVLGSIIEKSASILKLNIDEEGMEPLLGRSDQAPFLRAGIPSVFFFGGFHDDYHKPTDDIELVKVEKVCNVTRLAFLTSWFLANDTESQPREASGQ
ncbi:MAG TPA: hypothetical protein DGU45_05690 [Planctomycetes bacterium]|nr:hypothetical protein [Planctomycetota bacterium]